MFKKHAAILLGVALATCSATILVAEEDHVPTAAEKRAAWLRKVGGFCEGETEGKVFLYLNCADVDDKVFEEIINQMRLVCGIVIRHQRDTLNEAPLTYAKKVLRNRSDVGAVVVIYAGDPADPIESIYPMDRISIINVASLSSADQSVYSGRTTALACRSIAYLAGGAMPFGVDGCMKNVFDANGLDSLKLKMLHPMSGQLVKSSAEDFGFALWKKGTYVSACQEGWAHPPTNDIQRAVWEKVHAIPDKPIKIKYNPPMK